MTKTITSNMGTIGNISDQSTLLDMKNANPAFFHASFGKRETFTIYRGQLIVRHTVQHSGPDSTSVRRTIVYIFLPKGLSSDKDRQAVMFHLTSNCRNGNQARKLIDKVWKDGDASSYYQ